MSIQNYQLTDIRKEVKRRLNEVSNDGLWTTAELNTLINHALLRTTLDTRIPRSDETVNITKDVSWYFLPTDCMIPLFIFTSALWQQVRLFPSFFLSLDKQYGGMYQWEKDSSNTSQGFVPFSYNQFILWPPPSAVTTVTVHHVPYPAQLVNDTDTTILPLPAQHLIPIFASYLAMMKSDINKAAPFLKEYKQRLISVRELDRHQSQVRPTVMVPGISFDRSQANPEIRAYRNARRYYNG